MSARDLHADTKTETEQRTVKLNAFVQLMFSTPVRVWTGLGPIPLAMPGEASQTWDGIGSLGSISQIVESTDRRQNGIKLILSGVDNTLLGDALNEDYQGRDAKVWLALMNNNNTIVGDAELFFGGFMEQMLIAEGQKAATIELVCEPRDAQRRASETFLTDEEQRRINATDGSLRFVKELVQKQIVWGRPSPNSGAAGGIGGGRAGIGDGRFNKNR